MTKTSKQLKIQGTFLDKRHGKRLEIDPGKPSIPSFLGSAGKAEWKRLMDILSPMGVITLADRAALTLVCQKWEEYTDCCKACIGESIKEKNPTTDVTRVNPLFKARAEAGKDLNLFLKEFGLTPCSRTKVKIDKKPKKKEDKSKRFFNSG